MKFTAIVLAVLLTLSMTACMNNGKNPNTTTPNNQTPGTTDNGGTNGNTNNGTNNDVNNGANTNGSTNGNNGPTNGSNNNAAGENQNGNQANGSGTAAAERRVMYNGNLYEVTDETLDADEVGVELFSVTSIVTETPAEEGEAIGLDEGTKVFRLKNDNEYDEIAVEINNVFYKAVKKA